MTNFSYCISVTNNKGHASIETVHLIRPTYDKNEFYLEILREIRRENASNNAIQMFEFEHVRYIFNYRIEQFVRMQHFDEISTTHQLIYPNGMGITDSERAALYVDMLFKFKDVFFKKKSNKHFYKQLCFVVSF